MLVIIVKRHKGEVFTKKEVIFIFFAVYLLLFFYIKKYIFSAKISMKTFRVYV